MEIVPLDPELEPGEEVPGDEEPVPPELPLLLVPGFDVPVEVVPETVLPGTDVDDVELPLPPGDDEPLELVPGDDEPADEVPVPDVLCPDEIRVVRRVFFAAPASPGKTIVAAVTANPANTPSADRRVSERGISSSGCD